MPLGAADADTSASCARARRLLSAQRAVARARAGRFPAIQGRVLYAGARNQAALMRSASGAPLQACQTAVHTDHLGTPRVIRKRGLTALWCADGVLTKIG